VDHGICLPDGVTGVHEPPDEGSPIAPVAPATKTFIAASSDVRFQADIPSSISNVTRG